ncbi:MAG: hypothetical protein HY927_04315 [Elusimicrobia bacterium]|nr:hypothetical protein [Elusimicrobiota bacterium]
MDHERPLDEPSPTIVGPQPPGSGSGKSLKAPCGLEHLLALACFGIPWREKVLADPLAAADEAGLALSAGERAVVQSVPRDALEAMVESFCRRTAPIRPRIPATASWAAAAALLAASLTGCDKLEGMLGVVSMGITDQEPPAKTSTAKPPEKDREQQKKPEGGDAGQESDPGFRPENVPAPGGILGDEPPSKPLQSDDRIMIWPPPAPSQHARPAAALPPGGSPIEEASPQSQEAQPPSENVSRGIRGDVPPAKKDR